MLLTLTTLAFFRFRELRSGVVRVRPVADMVGLGLGLVVAPALETEGRHDLVVAKEVLATSVVEVVGAHHRGTHPRLVDGLRQTAFLARRHRRPVGEVTCEVTAAARVDEEPAWVARTTGRDLLVVAQVPTTEVLGLDVVAAVPANT